MVRAMLHTTFTTSPIIAAYVWTNCCFWACIKALLENCNGLYQILLRKCWVVYQRHHGTVTISYYHFLELQNFGLSETLIFRTQDIIALTLIWKGLTKTRMLRTTPYREIFSDCELFDYNGINYKAKILEKSQLDAQVTKTKEDQIAFEMELPRIRPENEMTQLFSLGKGAPTYVTGECNENRCSLAPLK